MNNNDDILEEYWCMTCGHTWLLWCEKGITNRMKIEWLNKINKEHGKIHEKNYY